MVLVGAVILPHGTMPFDAQDSEDSVKSCRDRYEGLPEDLKVYHKAGSLSLITFFMGV